MINNRFASRPSFSSIISQNEETKIPEDIEFDIRCLNMFNLFFGLKRAVFTKKKTNTGSRDLFEEFEKCFMSGMKILSCKAFDINSSITKRYCKLIDDVLILNKYVRHNPKKVKKISKDLLNALDKNLVPLREFWKGEEEKDKKIEIKRLKDLEVVKKSLNFEPLSTNRRSYDPSRHKENEERNSMNTEKGSDSDRDSINFLRRKSVEKYPKYQYKRHRERGTKSGQKSSREYFKNESEKFRSNIQKKIDFADLGSAIKPLVKEEDPFMEAAKEMQLISMISIVDESINYEGSSENDQSFNQKLDVSYIPKRILDLLHLGCDTILRV